MIVGMALQRAAHGGADRVGLCPAGVWQRTGPYGAAPAYHRAGTLVEKKRD